MKLKVYQQILKMTKQLFYITIIQCISFSVLFASNGSSQVLDLKNIYLTTALEEASLEETFSFIEQKTGLRFFYSSSSLDNTIQISTNSTPISLYNLLIKISKKANLKFKRINQTIIVDKISLKTSKNQRVTEEFKKNVTGKVTDIDGSGLPGVNIIIKGTTTGVVTDINGSYQISVPENATLVFTFVGFVSEEVQVTNQNIINMILFPDITQLDDVVVVSYGTVKKSELISAISSVKSEEISKASVRTIGEALQGRAAGVNVTAVSGEPGAGLVINIRGTGTINSGQDVLYVVDGFPVDRIEDINPNDVASIEILKDASATAIYGSRAANGVVLITTKSGKLGKIKIEFNGKVGVQKPSHLIEMNNAKNYAIARNTALVNSGGQPLFSEVEMSYLGDGTNWFDEIMRSGDMEDYTVSVSGGKESYNFYSSINYFNHTGLIKNSDYQRLVFRINQNVKLSESIKIGSNINFSNRKSNYIPDRDIPRGIVYEAMIVDPITPARYKRNYDTDPTFGDIKGNAFSQFGATLTDNWNPLGHLMRQNNTNKGLRVFGNAFIEIEAAKGLKLKSDIGLDIRRNEDTGFNPLFFIKLNDSDEIGSISKDNSATNNYVWTNTIAYSKELGESKISTIVGMVAEKNNDIFYGVNRRNITSNDFKFRYLSAADGVSTSYGGESFSSLLSYFGRVNYSYKNKYMLSASIRADGSSKFSKENRWGTFPAFSVGWNITKEDFMEGVATDWLTSIKVRVGWGKIGNASIPSGSTLSTVGGFDYWWWGNNYAFGETPGINIGIAPISPGNKSLTWETSVQKNFGIDAYFFDNKLSLTADYFIKKTTDLLLIEPIPTISGFQSVPWSNAGEIKNSGFEMMLNFKNKVGNLSYNTSLTMATLKNEIISIGRGDFISDGSYNGLDDVTRSEVGSSIGQFYGYVADGIFQNNAEINAHSKNGVLIQPIAEPGDVRFRDLNNDGKIDSDDKAFIGSPIPDLTYSFNLGINYKNFDISAFFQGVYGNEVFNGVKVFTNYGDGVKNLQADVLKKAWHGEGSSTTHPRIVANDLNQNSRVSTLYVEDGSYLRLKNLQLGYNLPKKKLEKINMDGLRIFVAAQNLFTWTKYTGIDPELASYSPLSTGVDYTVYPKATTYSLGINATF